jgi:hypothetical protein
MMAFPSRTRRVLDDIEPIPKQEARQWRFWRGRPTETIPARPPKDAHASEREGASALKGHHLARSSSMTGSHGGA